MNKSTSEKLTKPYKQDLKIGVAGVGMPGETTCPQASVVLAPQFFTNPTTTDDKKGKVIGGMEAKYKK